MLSVETAELDRFLYRYRLVYRSRGGWRREGGAISGSADTVNWAIGTLSFHSESTLEGSPYPTELTASWVIGALYWSDGRERCSRRESGFMPL